MLFETHVSDPDYLYGKTGVFNYLLSGNGAANFQVKEVNYNPLMLSGRLLFLP